MSRGGPFEPPQGSGSRAGLDERTLALVRLSALVATGAGPACFQRDVASARAAGATDDDMVATLVAVAPIVGLSRLVSTTSRLALGMGYDVDAALEEVGSSIKGDDHLRPES